MKAGETRFCGAGQDLYLIFFVADGDPIKQGIFYLIDADQKKADLEFDKKAFIKDEQLSNSEYYSYCSHCQCW